MNDGSDISHELEALKAENAKLRATISNLEAEIRKLVKLLTQGNRSEKQILPQYEENWLPFESEKELEEAKSEALAEANAVVAEIEKTRVEKKENKQKRSFPKHLPVETVVVELPPEERTCATHGVMESIGVDVTQTLVHVPAKLFIREKHYHKYACKCCQQSGVVSAPRPTSLVEGDKYDSSVAASIVQLKYDLHLPIYRQQDLFAGSGWQPSRSTLLNLLTQVCFVLEPLFHHLKKRVQHDSVVGIDDTTCRMLISNHSTEVPGDKGRRLQEKIAEAQAKGQDSILARMWVYRGNCSAPYHIFDFRVSRHRDGPDEFFASSPKCCVQGDCFSGNKAVVIAGCERLMFAACWAHARRKVFEASTYPELREKLLAMIHALYDIETRAQNMTSAERCRLRQKDAATILKGMKYWLDDHDEQKVLPKSDLGQAIRYLQNHWHDLNTYIDNGDIPIDNNSVEQLMKQVALGRKAWLFVGNMEAGERSAMLMSLVSSAKRHDLDVWVYIKDVLDKLLAGQTEYESLLPDNWKQANPTAIRTYRQEERRDKADRKQIARANRLRANKPKP